MTKQTVTLGLIAGLLLLFAAVPAFAQLRPESKFIKDIRDRDYAASYSYLLNGGNPNARDYDGVPALVVAAEMGDISVVNTLLKNGANPDITDREAGDTALVRAAGRGSFEIVRLLFAYDADLDLEDKSGETPLIKAVRAGHLEVVKFLVENKADLELTDYAGLTAYDHAKNGRSRRILTAFEEARKAN